MATAYFHNFRIGPPGGLSRNFACFLGFVPISPFFGTSAAEGILDRIFGIVWTHRSVSQTNLLRSRGLGYDVHSFLERGSHRWLSQTSLLNPYCYRGVTIKHVMEYMVLPLNDILYTRP